MRLKPSYNRKKLSKPAHPGLIVAAFIGVTFLNVAFAIGITGLLEEPYETPSGPTKTLSAKKVVVTAQPKPKPLPQPAPASVAPTPQPTISFSHSDVTTTLFWIGEDATADNNNIHNSSSAWVEDWVGAYGGIDNPTVRSGYLPTGFTPKENPFYIALPYNDLDLNGVRKSTAAKCGASSSEYSWCKNSWLAIRCNGKIAYGQWEDAGPNGEDDVNYVFGNSQPLNQFDSKAGLDVSPAISTFLGLSGVNKCDWAFVAASTVPDGPWKQTITTTPSYKVSQ